MIRFAVLLACCLGCPVIAMASVPADESATIQPPKCREEIIILNRASAEAAAKFLKNILKNKAMVAFDKPANAVIIEASPETIRAAKKHIERFENNLPRLVTK
jgi:hypothetical protein